MTGERAVIIDDDVRITEVFSEILQMHGIEVAAIGHNGNDAIKLFKKHLPNLMFMDVHMPELNGVEALTKIKKIPQTSKIIMVTSDTSERLEEQLQNMGVNAIIYKPFNIQKIIKIIDEVKNSSHMIVQH